MLGKSQLKNGLKIQVEGENCQVELHLRNPRKALKKNKSKGGEPEIKEQEGED